MSAPGSFEYAGGEFEHDAPYVEDGESGGGVGDLNSLLADLIGSGEYDDDDPDTCFSINAAASFAAISAPEEQLAELPLKALDVETLVNLVDVLTPTEIMQSILLLELFSVPASPAPPAIPSSLHRIPVFYAEVKSTNTDSDVHAWFRSNEKLLMQSLSLLGLGLNHEAIVSAASDATSEHQQPLLYSLLYHGAKVTRVSLLSDLLHDLFQLLSLPDVIDLEALDKQLVREMGLHECQRRFGASDPKDQEEEEAKSEEGDDTATAPQLAVTLRAKFRQPLDVVSTSSVADETADSFTLSLDGPHPSLSTPLHAASLRRTHSCLTDLDGELAVRLFIHHFVACHAAVAAAVDKQIGGDNESKDDSVAATTLASFLSGLTAHSSLASLLSPDTAAAKQPADFFRSLLAANRQLTRQRQQQQTQQDNSATGGA